MLAIAEAWKVAAAAVALASHPADAAIYKLDAVGDISSILLSNDGGLGPAPIGRMSVGDTFRLTATFDSEQAALSSFSAADPTTNIYYLLGSAVTISAGSYRSSFQPRFQTSASTQLWNDRHIGPLLVDAQSFEFSNYDFTGTTPFDVAGGLNSELVSLTNFDFSGVVRMSDFISELITSSASFNSKSLSYSYSSGQNPLAGPRPTVLVNINQVAWTISAVPEPAPFALFGAAAIGGLVVRIACARRRRRSLTGASSA